MPYKNKKDLQKYQREWLAKRRAEWIFSNGPCKQCGSSKNLEVDHIDPSKKLDHKVWSWSKERREAELAKCQVLCSLCHEKKTTLSKIRPVIHGTHTGQVRGCRCAACKQAHKLYMRSLRAKKRSSGGMADTRSSSLRAP